MKQKTPQYLHGKFAIYLASKILSQSKQRSLTLQMVRHLPFSTSLQRIFSRRLPYFQLPFWQWIGPTAYQSYQRIRRTAKSLPLCILFFAHLDVAKSGEDACLCCLHSVPSGPQRTPAHPQPQTAIRLCCTILWRLYAHFVFGRRCRHGCPRCLYCPNCTHHSLGRRIRLVRQSHVLPLDAAPMLA